MCTVVDINSVPYGQPFRQFRGLPTGAPEAPVLFLVLVLWREAGRPAWDAAQPPDVITARIQAREEQILPTRNITYADDRNNMNLSERTAQRPADWSDTEGL